MRFLTIAILSTVLGASCAQGTVEPFGDAGTTTTDPDMGTIVVPTDQGTNNPNPIDVGPQVNNCGMCCPGELRCIDDATAGTCRADGSGFEPTPCAEGSTCNGGNCLSDTTCEPGEVDCFDDKTILRCRASGDGYVQMTCEGEFSCSQGICTDKTPLGGGCTTDDECASGNCRCGSGTDDGCSMDLGGGICADTGCMPGGCGMNGHCLDSASVPTGGTDYDHCVRACDDNTPCPMGSRCVAVPTKDVAGGVEFQNACYFEGVRSFGDECTTDAQCLTGTCLTDYFDTGFCTRRCDDDGLCPGDGAACAEIRSGEFWCTLVCGDGSPVGSDPCPLDEPVERFDVSCSNKSIQDGGVLRVCTAV